MSALGLSLIAFICIFGATLAGTLLRPAVPKRHLRASETKDAIRLSMGVVGTMAALVLGLLLASAKNSYDAKNSQVKQMVSHIILLDQILAQYGPEALTARKLLRLGTGPLADKIWNEGDLTPAAANSFTVGAGAELFLAKVEELAPKNDYQRSMRDRAIGALGNLAQTRLLLYAQADNSLPLPFLALLIFWLAILFASFSLFSAPNPIVITAYFVCAFSASGAIFLILELNRPFTGLMAISEFPLRNALGPL